MKVSLKNLLKPFEVENFFDRHFEQRVLHVRSDNIDRFSNMFSLDMLERHLSTNVNNIFDSLRIIQDNEEVLPQTDYDRNNMGIWTEKLFGEGASVIVDSVELISPATSNLCQVLARELQGEVSANAYLTPPAGQTFPAHFDTHDTLILQVEGTKRWKIYHQEIEAPLSHQNRSLDASALSEPAQELQLNVGDLLYIPKGIVHEAETQENLSLHLTISLAPFTWLDFAVELLTVAAENHPALRYALPRERENSIWHERFIDSMSYFLSLCGQPSSMTIGQQKITEKTAQQLDSPEVSLKFDQAKGQPLSIDQVVKVRRGAMIASERMHGAVRLYLPSRSRRSSNYCPEYIDAPIAFSEAVEFLEKIDRPFRIDEIVGPLSTEAKLGFCLRLIRERILEIDASVASYFPDVESAGAIEGEIP